MKDGDKNLLKIAPLITEVEWQVIYYAFGAYVGEKPPRETILFMPRSRILKLLDNSNWASLGDCRHFNACLSLGKKLGRVPVGVHCNHHPDREDEGSTHHGP